MSPPTRFAASNLRSVFGAFPTGVTAVAALVAGAPVGLAASSFTSVSLTPPLVSVCVARASTTWPLLAGQARLGVSVLATGHSAAARRLSGEARSRFTDVSWRAGPHGAVYLNDACAWMECSVSLLVPAGDHQIALLAVHDLEATPELEPLIFHASGFRHPGPALSDPREDAP